MKVVKIDSYGIVFEDGTKIYSDHQQDCCESHYLNLEDLSLEDFNGLDFDLSGEDFFNRIDGYGIELIPIGGRSVKIAGHGYNNGYYSSELTLVLEDAKGIILKRFDISDCQTISD